MIDGPAPTPAEDAKTVGVVEHRETAVLLGDLGEFGQARDVTLHRVHALDHQHLRRLGVERGEHRAKVVGAVVGESLHRGHGEPDSVPKAGVDVLVGEDEVALLGERSHAGEAG